MKNSTYLTLLAVFSGIILGGWLAQTPPSGGAYAAEERTPPQLKVDSSPLGEGAGEDKLSYADIIEMATPSVVGINTARFVSVQGNRGNLMEEFLRRYYGFPSPETEEREDQSGELRQPIGAGSGVILSEDGYILTNNHVIRVGRSSEIVDEIIVKTADGREFNAEVVGSDPQTDIAVLKVDPAEPLPAITIADSDRVRVGDVCFAIGNPLEVGLTVTKGIVSALNRNNLGILGRSGYENFIQTDASINMGNSGGALIDARGRLIGINTAILSRTGGNIGIGFAIPSNLATYIMNSLVEKGEVPRGFLGVLPTDLDRDTAEAFGLKSIKGALINQVEAGQAADKAGIRHGDIILEVDGREVQNAASLRTMIAQTFPGTTVTLKVFRDGEILDVDVTLGDLEQGVASIDGTTAEDLLPGMSLSILTAEERSKYSVPDDVEGLVITSIDDLNEVSRKFREGMVISEVNGKPVRDFEELKNALGEGLNQFYTWFDGYNRFVVARID